jgi:CheY-like chemotaxis protein
MLKGQVPTKSDTACSVLIVQDEWVTRDALLSILTKRGHAVVAAATVAAGLAALDGQDCAIVDLNLPDGLGTVILERIRTENRPIQVAIATGTTDASLLSEARKLRPDLLWHKPVDVEGLLAWVERPRPFPPHGAGLNNGRLVHRPPPEIVGKDRRSSRENETVDSLQRMLENHRRNVRLCPRDLALPFQIEIDRIEKLLAEFDRKKGSQ